MYYFIHSSISNIKIVGNFIITLYIFYFFRSNQKKLISYIRINIIFSTMCSNKINIYKNGKSFDISGYKITDTRIKKITAHSSYFSIHFNRFICVESEFKTFVDLFKCKNDSDSLFSYKYIYNDAILYEYN